MRTLLMAGGTLMVAAVGMAPAMRAQTEMKPMAADANPSFDVATVRPNNLGEQEHRINVTGRHLTIQNMSFQEIVAVVFEMQPKQIAGGPDWVTKETWDVSGVPDKEGRPTEDQWKLMLKKLMAERFHLKFHTEKREMAAYVLTAPQGAAKLTPSKSSSPLPGFDTDAQPGSVTIGVRNARMQDLCEYMQVRVLERPLVDETGISGRYDFAITFLPDGSQFKGRMPPDAVAGTAPAPSLYTAMEEQDGLKLEARKAEVPVMVIDQVDRPTEN